MIPNSKPVDAPLFAMRTPLVMVYFVDVKKKKKSYSGNSNISHQKSVENFGRWFFFFLFFFFVININKVHLVGYLNVVATNITKHVMKEIVCVVSTEPSILSGTC